MRIIGDVHGDIDAYLELLSVKESIQLGDMGFDYSRLPIMSHHRIVAGNHENYSNLHCNFLGDFGVWKDIFFIRGAFSVDAHRRTEGVDLFAYQEQLTCAEGLKCLAAYSKAKPDIVVSHDCPVQVIQKMYSEIRYPNCTSQLLGALWEVWQPKLWFFGHHHRDYSTSMCLDRTTKFRCVDILNFVDI